MKKIVYLLVSLVLVFSSCNPPLEDIDAALEEATKLDGVVGDVSYTLISEDYTEDVEDGGFGFSNEYLREPYEKGFTLIIVSLRSGPVDIISIGTPVSSSIRLM